MKDFEEALAEYRNALELVVAAVTKDSNMLEVHENGLRLIERQYADTGTVKACRDLIVAEQSLHEVDGLRGEAVMKARGVRAVGANGLALERCMHVLELARGL